MTLNKVILIGYVGKDPEIRYIENNVPVARITLATTERGFTTANGTQVPERSEWHTITAWRGLAELAEKYIRKGSQLYVEGKITYRTWTDKNGISRTNADIIADTIQLMGAKKADSATTQAPAQTQPSTAPQAVPPTGDNVNDMPF